MHGSVIMFARSSSLRLVPLALVFSLACSANVDLVGGGGSDNGGGEGPGGQGSGGGNNSPQCIPFHDAEPLSAITIRIRNESGQDIYLPAACNALEYAITPVSGEDGVYYGPAYDSCFQSCEELQTSELEPCPADACAATSIRLAPGSNIEVPWDGRGLINGNMPAECWYSQDFGSQCTQIVNASSGDYAISLQGFSDCGEGCECDEQGLCFGQASGIEAYPNAATATLPSKTVVEVLFDVCAFGCAEPGGGGQ